MSRKADIVERIIFMKEFGCIRRPDETATPDLACLTYFTKDVRIKLQCLPGFSTVTDYLVCGRDKTFDMQSMRAFKSLKAYLFFLRI